MIHEDRKSNVDELNIDVYWAYQEFCVTHDGVYYLLLNLTKVISVAAVGECNDLFVGIIDCGANLVNIEAFCCEEEHKFTVYFFVLGTTAHLTA